MPCGAAAAVAMIRSTFPRPPGGTPPGRRAIAMKVYDAADIRNVAIVGHGGSGKTQLVSALLFVAGAVNRLGRVDDGSTVTDFDEEEIARQNPLSSHPAPPR